MTGRRSKSHMAFLGVRRRLRIVHRFLVSIYILRVLQRSSTICIRCRLLCLRTIRIALRGRALNTFYPMWMY